MRILAIETATPCVGCALWADGGPLASFVLVAGQRHAEVLMPAVDALCRQAGLSVADLDAVAVDVGPGLFTGLRVGLATASTIASARGLPAVGVTSLDTLAQPHRRRRGLLAAIVDARRSEVYWSLYRSDGAVLSEVRPMAVDTPDDVAVAIAGLDEPPLAVGDGALRYRDALAEAGADIAGTADQWPAPLVVAELAAQRLASSAGPFGPPAPLYLRPPNVRIGWEQSDGRVGPGATAGAAFGRAETRLGT